MVDLARRSKKKLKENINNLIKKIIMSVEDGSKKQNPEIKSEKGKEEKDKPTPQEIKEERKPRDIERAKEKRRRGELLSNEEVALLKEVEEEEQTKAEKEKTPEDVLKESRENFAKLDREAEKWMKIEKKHGPSEKITKEDFAKSETGQEKGYKKVKEEYLNALIGYRKQKIKELEEANLSSEEKNKKKQEILKETIAKEANALHEAKNSAEIDEKGNSKKEKIKETAKGVAEWYRSLPLKYKLGISATLLGASAVAGGIGGVAGTALATGAFAGSRIQTGLAGAGAAVGLEGLMKRGQERKAEKEVQEKIASKLEEKLKKSDGEIENKLFELEGKKKGERYKRYVLAGTMGALIGTGAVGKAIGSIGEWFGIGTDEVSEKTTAEAGNATNETVEGRQWQAAVGPEVAEKATEEFVVEISEGDSVWSVTEDQLEERFGERFDNLNEAQKTHLIDNIKDKIAADPEKFGFEIGQDIDNLQPGDKIDLSSVLGDEAVQKMFESTEDLSNADMESIIENNEEIRQWVVEHPGEPLTSEKVEEVLSDKQS